MYSNPNAKKEIWLTKYTFKKEHGLVMRISDFK